MSGSALNDQIEGGQRGERRRATRMPVSLSGFVRGADQALHIPCRIIDISSTGARATIASETGRSRSAKDLPTKVVLTFCLDQVEVLAEVRWDSSSEFGVKFESGFRHLKAKDGKRKPQFGSRLTSTPSVGTA